MTRRFLFVLFLLAACVAQAAATEQIRLCDQDIYNEAHTFYWGNLKSILPDNLGPGEARRVYQEIFDRYARQLSEDDKRQPFVRTFITLQGDIVRGLKSANLTMKPGFDGEELSSGSDRVADVPCEDKDKAYLITIKYVTIAYKKVHDASWEALRGAATQRIAQLDRQYADWFNNGLPMWPMETWANGKLLGRSDATSPKRWQLVVLRPTVGLGVNADSSLSDTKPAATLAIEPLGYVRYTEGDYSRYWGVSLLLTTGDDVGIGGGLLGRYDNYVLGLTKRRANPDYGVSSADLYVFIGFDLYNLVHNKQDQFRGFKGKVRANLEKYGGLLQ